MIDCIDYKVLSADDVGIELFKHFDRTQIVTKCTRKINGAWVAVDAPFVDNWSEAEYLEGVEYLKNLIACGGYAVGAFCNGQLKGFMSVEPEIFGNDYAYMDLSNIHVSRDMRGMGIGRELFLLAKKWAKEHHAEKLYISAHSAIESQAFYKAMGCVEAVEYNQRLVEREPFDCQLECKL